MRRPDPSLKIVSLSTRLKFQLLCGVVALVATSAGAADAANPPSTSRRWLRWLKPLSRQDAPARVIPSPIDLNQEWTMDKALARALQANPDVQVALAGVERSEGLRMQAAGALFPRISVVASLDQ